MDAAVRHTPLTATLSPAERSPANGDSIDRRCPVDSSGTASTRPTASMSPVNIPLHEPVGRESALAHVAGLLETPQKSWRLGDAPAKRDGRHDALHPPDQLRVEKCLMQHGT